MTNPIGRESLLTNLAGLLQERSLTLVGARRVGKTTLLGAFAARGSRAMTTRVVDLQGLTTLEHFVARTTQALRPATALSSVQAAAGRVQDVNFAGVGGIRLASAAPPDPWAPLEASLLDALPEDDGLLVVALDELPWWLDALERGAAGAARTTLARLRRLRHDPPFERVRWVFTGSVGLAGRAVDWDASAELNDLDLLVVPPVDVAAGATIFEIECGPCDRAGAIAAHEVAGGLPHWIRVLATRCRAAAGGGRVTDVDVEREVQRMLDPNHRQLFQEEGLGHFGRRYDVSDRAIAVDVLDVLAQAAKPQPVRGVVTAVLADDSSRNKLSIERIIWQLVDEFYLAPGPDGHVAIAVPLFRRWWAKWGRV